MHPAHRQPFVLVLALLCACGSARAPARPSLPQPMKRLAVLEFTNADLSGDILDTLSDAVRGGAIDALANSNVSIMTRESMKVMLKDMGIQECHEGECEVETARSIHADYVVSGRIVRMEGSYVVTLKVHETEQANLLGTKEVMVDTQKAMMGEIREQGRRLVAETIKVRAGVSPASTQPAVSPPVPAGRKSERSVQAVRGCSSNQVAIPGGTFWMGSEDGQDDEKPAHRVILSSYCMDKTEVTVAAYRACVQAGECELKEYSQLCNWGEADLEQHPLNCVDWNQAATYCAWKGGRLPTEAEWEFAARGSDGRRYPWGDEPPTAQLCWNGKENDLGTGNRHDGTCPVGQYPSGASPFGVLDMAGNVWEWTADSYGSYPKDAQRNPSRSGPDASPRVFRGGGWFSDAPSAVRAANRFGIGPGYNNNDLGFRCARGAQM